jgi:hypothetical protein
MTKKGSVGFFLIVTAAATLAAASDPAIPEGYKIDRYLGLRNPFVFPETAPAAPKPSVFEKLVLESWSEIGSEIVVYVRNTETNVLERVTAIPNANSFRFVALRSNPDVKRVVVILSNGSEDGAVKFKTAAKSTVKSGGEGSDYVPPPRKRSFHPPIN